MQFVLGLRVYWLDYNLIISYSLGSRIAFFSVVSRDIIFSTLHLHWYSPSLYKWYLIATERSLLILRSVFKVFLFLLIIWSIYVFSFSGGDILFSSCPYITCMCNSYIITEKSSLVYRLAYFHMKIGKLLQQFDWTSFAGLVDLFDL